MDRREMLGLLGAGAAGLTALSSAQADEKSADACCQLDQVHADCLKSCSECAEMCDKTYHHCFTALSKGKTEHAWAMHMVGDCASFCAHSACMIAKHSPLMAYSCNACAEACRATAAELDKGHDDMMKSAAHKLRECEKHCYAMIEDMKKKHTDHRTG